MGRTGTVSGRGSGIRLLFPRLWTEAGWAVRRALTPDLNQFRFGGGDCGLHHKEDDDGSLSMVAGLTEPAGW